MNDISSMSNDELLSVAAQALGEPGLRLSHRSPSAICFAINVMHGQYGVFAWIELGSLPDMGSVILSSRSMIRPLKDNGSMKATNIRLHARRGNKLSASIVSALSVMGGDHLLDDKMVNGEKRLASISGITDVMHNIRDHHEASLSCFVMAMASGLIDEMV